MAVAHTHIHTPTVDTLVLEYNGTPSDKRTGPVLFQGSLRLCTLKHIVSVASFLFSKILSVECDSFSLVYFIFNVFTSMSPPK